MGGSRSEMCATRTSVSASDRAELTKNATTIGFDPLLRETAVIVVSEDVRQLKRDPLLIGWERSDRRLRELTDALVSALNLSGRLSVISATGSSTS